MSSWHVQDSFAFTCMYYEDFVETEDVKFNCLELRRSLPAHLLGSLTFTCDVMPQVGWLVHPFHVFILLWPTRSRVSTSHVYRRNYNRAFSSWISSYHTEYRVWVACCFLFGMSWVQTSAVLSEVPRGWKPRCHFLLIAGQFGIVHPVVFIYTHQQRGTDFGCHVLAAKFCTVAPNVCWNSV